MGREPEFKRSLSLRDRVQVNPPVPGQFLHLVGRGDAKSSVLLPRIDTAKGTIVTGLMGVYPLMH